MIPVDEMTQFVNDKIIDHMERGKNYFPVEIEDSPARAASPDGSRNFNLYSLRIRADKRRIKADSLRNNESRPLRIPLYQQFNNAFPANFRTTTGGPERRSRSVAGKRTG